MSTTNIASSIAWTKLRTGAWGIRSARQLTEGASVAVAKRDGSTSSATVGALVWTDKTTAWIYAVGASSSTASRTPPNRSRGGSAASVRGYSSYCTGQFGCGCYDCAS